ncbi:LCP family protein, partial [Candidatus Saccharibacteria bacterium]|nr:LCP family protein [Candidatus Saccharibacteria bacterium]
KSEEEAESIAIDATERTMEEVLGIPIHYYVMVDFEAFRRAIDTVGGVTVDVKEPLYDYNVAWENDWDPLIAPAGVQQFDGKKALLYARSRYGSARGDFDRAERQRQILVALRDKIFSLGTFGNPLKISQLMDAFGDHVSTNLSIDDVMSLYELAKEVEGHEVTSIGLADPPNDYVVTDNIGGLSVVVPKEGLYQYGAIHTYIRNALKDGFVRKENPSIIVLNGTTESGRASEFADTLKGYGYNVVEVSDAPSTDYEETVFVNLRGKDKAYTQRYIEQRLGVKATGKLPSGVENPNNADFIIILGPGS